MVCSWQPNPGSRKQACVTQFSDRLQYRFYRSHAACSSKPCTQSVRFATYCIYRAQVLCANKPFSKSGDLGNRTVLIFEESRHDWPALLPWPRRTPWLWNVLIWNTRPHFKQIRGYTNHIFNPHLYTNCLGASLIQTYTGTKGSCSIGLEKNNIVYTKVTLPLPTTQQLQ